MSPEEAICLELAFTYLNPLLPNTSLNDIRPYLKESEAVLNETASTKMKRWKDKVQTINEGFQLKQAKIKDGLSDILRFTINSTIGLAGFFDIASSIGFQKHSEDFGQTLAVWGVSDGPYIVLPILGPSTLRDTLATVSYTHLTLPTILLV